MPDHHNVLFLGTPIRTLPAGNLRVVHDTGASSSTAYFLGTSLAKRALFKFSFKMRLIMLFCLHGKTTNNR
jgi:hypothetical protein